jgi:hypothetical protein
MYIVQNRKTGLYYRNTSGRAWRRKDGDWVSDLQDVKPFRNMAAVRNVFAGTGGVYYDFSRRKWENQDMPECCKQMKWSSNGGVTRQCQHYKDAVRAVQDKARAKYRVLRVRLVLNGEEEL